MAQFCRDFWENFQICALDARNHSVRLLRFQEMAEDVVSFLDDNGLQRIIFIGHSLVGKTAMKFTVQFPERILSLIMVDIETVQYKHLQKILEQIEAM